MVIFVENICGVLSVYLDRYMYEFWVYCWVVVYGMLGVLVDGNDVEVVCDCVVNVVVWVCVGGGFMLV